jgi:uncharacterized protein (DUF58 family)
MTSAQSWRGPAWANYGWRATWAHARAVALGTLGPLVALVFHRPDVVVVSTPLVAIATWAVLTRPRGEVRVSQRLGRTTLREGESLALRCRVEASPGTQELSVAYQRHPWVRTRPRGGVRTAIVNASSPTFEVTTVARMVRWGHHGVGAGTVGATSSWGAYQWGPLVMEERDVEVIPAAAVFDARAPMPHPQGVVGVDRSARPGEGSEFATIREFQLGDRLRRIHWPSSLRSRALNVTSTYADHDSQVLVYVDAANDLGISGGIDGQPSTLDLTVRAAAALCEHYARRGDRVGLQVSRSQAAVLIPPSSGRGHLRRVLSSLANVRAGDLLGDSREPRLRINPGAVVLMCSPLISPTAMQRAVSLAGRGLTLVIIDTLPVDIVLATETVDDETDEVTMLAWRMRMLERGVDIRQVTQAGIPVVPWRGPGSLDNVLRDVARRARAPRLARR